MSFLTLNGLEAASLAKDFSMDPEKIGAGVTRAADASARNNYQDIKQHAHGKTPPLDQAHAVFLAALLDGRFDHWAFSADLYSDKGLGYSSQSGSSFTAGGGRNSTGKLTLAATTGQATWVGCFVSKVGMTLFIGRYESAAWHDYALTWNASGTLQAVYMDGAAQAVSLPSWLAVTWSTQTVEILNTAGTTQDYCELFIVSAQSPTDSMASVSNWRASNAMTTTPFALTCGGNFHPVTLTMVGKVGGVGQQLGTLSGVQSNNLRSMAFELFEV